MARTENDVRRLNLDGLQLLESDPPTAFAKFNEAYSMLTNLLHTPEADSYTHIRALAATENNLGLFYRHVSQLLAAESHLVRAARLEAELGEEAQSPGATLLNLYQVRREHGDLHGAEEVLEAAIHAQKVRLAKDSLTLHERETETRLLGRALSTRAASHYCLHRFADAIEYYRSAIDLYDTLQTETDRLTARELQTKVRQATQRLVDHRPTLRDDATNRCTSERRAPSTTTGKQHVPTNILRQHKVFVAKAPQKMKPLGLRIARVPLLVPRISTTDAASTRLEEPEQLQRAAPPTSTSKERPQSARTTLRRHFASDEISLRVYSQLAPRHREAYDALSRGFSRPWSAVARASPLSIPPATTDGATTVADVAVSPAVNFSTPPEKSEQPPRLPIPRPPPAPPLHLWRPRDTPPPVILTPSPPSGGTDPGSVRRVPSASPAPAAEAQSSSVTTSAPDVECVEGEAVEPVPRGRGQALPDTVYSDAAVVVQHSWRRFKRRQKAHPRESETAVTRIEEPLPPPPQQEEQRPSKDDLDALVRRIRDEEREAARTAARLELADRERLLAIRWRELRLLGDPKKSPSEAESRSDAAQRAALLSELLHLGSELDELQTRVINDVVPSRQYLNRVREERHQRRTAAATRIQSMFMARLSRNVVRRQHRLLVERALAEWSQRQLRRRSAIKIQRFFLSTLAVSRAAEIEAAKRASALLRATHMVLHVQLHLRASSAVRAARNRAAKMVLRGFLRLQATFRSRMLRAEFDIRRTIYRAQCALKLESTQLLAHHAAYGDTLLEAESVWWAELVQSHMGTKPHYAATLIKAVWRRHCYGKPVERRWRAHYEQRLARKMALEKAERFARAAAAASLILQRVYRLHLARRQRRYRFTLQLRRKIDYLELAERSYAARTLQRYFLVVRAKREKINRRETVRQLRLVAAWRHAKLEEERAILAAAARDAAMATRIQSYGRSYLSRKALRRYRIDTVRRWELRLAQLLLSRCGRGYSARLSIWQCAVARHKSLQQERVVVSAVSVIQSYCRAAIASDITSWMSVQVFTRAAVLLQSVGRGWKIRRSIDAPLSGAGQLTAGSEPQDNATESQCIARQLTVTAIERVLLKSPATL